MTWNSEKQNQQKEKHRKYYFQLNKPIPFNLPIDDTNCAKDMESRYNFFIKKISDFLKLVECSSSICDNGNHWFYMYHFYGHRMIGINTIKRNNHKNKGSKHNFS